MKVEIWKHSKVVIWTTLYHFCVLSPALSPVVSLTARSWKWHVIVFTSGFVQLRNKSVLLGSKSGPHMITELSCRTVKHPRPVRCKVAGGCGCQIVHSFTLRVRGLTSLWPKHTFPADRLSKVAGCKAACVSLSRRAGYVVVDMEPPVHLYNAASSTHSKVWNLTPTGSGLFWELVTFLYIEVSQFIGIVSLLYCQTVEGWNGSVELGI